MDMPHLIEDERYAWDGEDALGCSTLNDDVFPEALEEARAILQQTLQSRTHWLGGENKTWQITSLSATGPGEGTVHGVFDGLNFTCVFDGIETAMGLLACEVEEHLFHEHGVRW
jgi:hypothetical protein